PLARAARTGSPGSHASPCRRRGRCAAGSGTHSPGGGPAGPRGCRGSWPHASLTAAGPYRNYRPEQVTTPLTTRRVFWLQKEAGPEVRPQVRPKITTESRSTFGLSGRAPARGSRRPEGVSTETACEIIHEALPRKREGGGPGPERARAPARQRD